MWPGVQVSIDTASLLLMPTLGQAYKELITHCCLWINLRKPPTSMHNSTFGNMKTMSKIHKSNQKKKVAIVGSQQIDALINKSLVLLCSPVHRTAWKSLFYLGTRITCWFTAVGLCCGDKSIQVQSFFSECALINKHRICMYGPSTIHGWRNARQTNWAKFQLFSQKLIYLLDWLSCAVAQLMSLSLSQLFPVDNGKSIKVLKGA